MKYLLRYTAEDVEQEQTFSGEMEYSEIVREAKRIALQGYSPVHGYRLDGKILRCLFAVTRKGKKVVVEEMLL